MTLPRLRPCVLTLTMICTATATTLLAQTQADAPRDILTFDGQTAILTVAIKPDKTADFEGIMRRLHQVLQKSDDPKQREQAAGWKLVRLQQAMPDGTIAYVHVISPVVPGVDYSVLQNLYKAFPDEQQTLYEQYRNAFDKNLSLAVGTAVDLEGQ